MREFAVNLAVDEETFVPVAVLSIQNQPEKEPLKFPIEAMIQTATFMGRNMAELVEAKVRRWLSDVTDAEVQQIIKLANA
ncbi:hypothetical protein [Ralstonia phage RSP15]|uniref:hypothetical protein n=1 Tax=Ralstonia phage RSP15 TaxID=1785960 RepID=UPI00074D2A29|nr:hypothetical protein BH754_gp230 [Ralstonia phage RSP15]BAU40076.1 hypothetical protein [Ralstonia phage RSP15]